jgi:hypothetical protein
LTGDAPQPSASHIAALIAANSSLLVAAMVYMGWAYDDALYGYFHLHALNLGMGVTEYLLYSVNLFSPTIIVSAAALVAATAIVRENATPVRNAARKLVARWEFSRRMLEVDRADRAQALRTAQLWSGALLTAAAVACAYTDRHTRINGFLVIAMLAIGPLLATGPSRIKRRGRTLYTLGLAVAGLCVLWLGGAYAHSLGIRTAESFAASLNSQTAVSVYSVQQLSLDGPGVKVTRLSPGYRYRYRYDGLRLLTTRAGTYYLLPRGWSLRQNYTYVVDDSDQVWIMLY